MKIAMFAVFALFLAQARAPQATQMASGTIAGSVMDPTGARIPGVTVTLKNALTGSSAVQITNESGDYKFTNVLPGTGYTLTAELTGMNPQVISMIDLVGNQALQFNFRLTLGPNQSARNQKLTFSADRTTNVGIVTQYRGHVRMSSNSFVATADEMDFDATTQLANMRGNVSVHVLPASAQVVPISR